MIVLTTDPATGHIEARTDAPRADRIGRVHRLGDGWAVTFDRGPRNRGPHVVPSRERGVQYLARYASAHEDQLRKQRGPSGLHKSGPWPYADGCDAMGNPYPVIVVAKRRQRRPRR